MSGYTNGMTLEEQIGQLFVVGFASTTPSPEIIDLIQRYHVGGVIFFARNVSDTQQVLDLTRSLQEAARSAGQPYPLLITIDQENGMVQRLGKGSTSFPGNMALGAVGSEQIAYDVALACGRELKALGVNMNFAPVADVNNNPANPVIGVRSFGEDAQQVARLVAAEVKGYQDAGVIATLKHFPGHGDTSVDSHLALPTITSTLEHMEQIELVPFKSGIAAGAGSIMTAHVYFPALVQETLPATIAPAVLRGLLREQLGFSGAIVTDCLEMNAISDTVGTERGAVLSLLAGSDLVLISHHHDLQRGGIEAVRAAVQSGELSEDVIRQAAERVLSLKARFLSWDDQPGASVPSWVGGEEHQQLRDQAYELSTTLVRNDENLLPLRLQPGQRVLTLSPQLGILSRVARGAFPQQFFFESIQQRHEHVSSITLSPQPTEAEYQEILQAAREADIVIAVTVNAHLDQTQAELIQRLVQTEKRIIGIAAGNPYDLLAFPQLRTYLVTYEYTKPALTAAVRVLFGEIPSQGHLPVSLPGLYPLGHGL
jgi:beta-N-acetylhexosaminidase